MASGALTAGGIMGNIAIGIDLGGTRLRAALADEHGMLLARHEVPTDADAGAEHVVARMGDLADILLAGIGCARIVGMGVACPGPLDTETGTALGIPTLPGFSDFPLRARLQARFPFPVHVENDGIAAAIGEWQFGAGRGHAHMLYITVSTGIGGGVIADNRVLRGRKGMAGHIGHMTMVPDGALCACGNCGCFEAYGSGTAFTRRAREQALVCRQTMLGRDGADIDSRAVFAAAREGDALARRLIAEEADILGRGLTSLIHIFSPDIVVMGGGLSSEFECLHAGIRASIGERVMPAFRDVEVVRAALGQNSGLTGAAALAFLGTA